MTSMALHDAVCDFLEANVAAKLKLPAKLANGKDKTEPKEQTLMQPVVRRNGALTPKSISGKDEDEIAFILPWLQRVENISGERESVATVAILFGVLAGIEYDGDGMKVDDGGGYRDLWNIIETSRLALFTAQTIDDRFMLVSDFFEAEILPEPIYPYWEGFCRTRWHIAYPLPPLGEKFF